MSRIYEALRRAEGAPVDENDTAETVKPARGAAPRVTLEEYPRETPAQAEPPAAATQVLHERRVSLPDRRDPVAPVPPPRSERPLPAPPERHDPLAPLRPREDHPVAPRGERHDAAPPPAVRPLPPAAAPPAPALPAWDELLAPAEPLKLDRGAPTPDAGDEPSSLATPLSKKERIVALKPEGRDPGAAPAVWPDLPAPVDAPRRERPATPAAPRRPAAPQAERAAPESSERSAALQAAMQSRKAQPPDRPARSEQPPSADTAGNIWSSSVEGITSTAHRVDRSKGRWIKAIFRKGRG